VLSGNASDSGLESKLTSQYDTEVGDSGVNNGYLAQKIKHMTWTQVQQFSVELCQ